MIRKRPEFRFNETNTEPSNIRGSFHEHLERCDQCRKGPFGLCLEGRRIRDAIMDSLRDAATEMKAWDQYNKR